MTVAPGELAYAGEGDSRKPLPGGPVHGNTIIEAVSEVLSNDDILALSPSRPRIIRHEHDGDDFVLEVIRYGSGIALGIRIATRGARPAPPKARQSRRYRPSKPPPGPGIEAPRPPPVPADLARPIGRERPIDQQLEAPNAPLELDDRRPARPAAPPAPPEADPRRQPSPMAVVRSPPPPAMEGQPEIARAKSGGARIDELLREMIAKKASDLHLSTLNPPIFRVDGEIHFLRERPILQPGDIDGMMREIMTEKARVDFDALNDADFAYEIKGLARFRVNVFADRNGVGAVLRQIPIEILSAEKLGLPKACLDMCWLSKGLVVVTGPTGSGKSTTLAAMVDFINKNRSEHIITIEDPVEFVHQNAKCLVNQREVGQHTKSFKAALRAALREDPDIVLVGEMRDLETIAIAIETAETGHLVFGTLHTTTATSTVDRIIDQFPSDRQAQVRVMLSESLKGVVAQTLLPKIGGGRVAAHEILLGTPAVTAIIRDGKTFQLPSVMQTSKGAGMVTLNDALMNLIQKKLVDPKQAYLKAVDKNGLVGLMKSAGIPVTFV